MDMKLHSLLKFAIFFTILLTATAVEMSGTSGVNKAMALGSFPLYISMMQLKLLPNEFEPTCSRSCSSDAECSDGWVCRWCWSHLDPFDNQYYYRCSMLPN
ncbi:hypothetical protein P3S68_001282 [Capsicum galapagoense]